MLYDGDFGIGRELYFHERAGCWNLQLMERFSPVFNFQVLYISLHRHEDGRFYPGTGAAHEVTISDLFTVLYYFFQQYG